MRSLIIGLTALVWMAPSAAQRGGGPAPGPVAAPVAAGPARGEPPRGRGGDERGRAEDRRGSAPMSMPMTAVMIGASPPSIIGITHAPVIGFGNEAFWEDWEPAPGASLMLAARKGERRVRDKPIP